MYSKPKGVNSDTLYLILFHSSFKERFKKQRILISVSMRIDCAHVGSSASWHNMARKNGTKYGRA